MIPPTEPSRAPGKLALTNLLEWPDRDKATLVALMTLPFFVGCLPWLWFADNFTDFGQNYFRPEGVRLMYGVLLFGAVGWSLLLAVGLWMRHRGTASDWFTLCPIFFYGISLIPLGYAVGLAGPLTGLIMLGGTLVGFVIFGFPRVFASFVVNCVLLLIATLLTALGELLYAPLFRLDPLMMGDMSPFWLGTLLAFGLPFVIASFGVTWLLLRGWESREEETRRLALTDTLTGIANRRAILDVLKPLLASTRRDARPLTVVMLDLDHFKAINDTWGHSAGDKVLKAVAHVMLQTLRESDWVGRYGGEEFVLILPATDAEGAHLVLERCRIALHELSFTIGHDELKVTGSFGFCTVNAGETLTVDQALHHADMALYAAKAGGRDCVVSWQPAMGDDADPLVEA